MNLIFGIRRPNCTHKVILNEIGDPTLNLWLALPLRFDLEFDLEGQVAHS